MKKALLSISLFTIYILGTAQIQYTDVIPNDTLVPDYVSDSKIIDFDGDFNPELIIFSKKQDTVISGFNVTISGIAISTLGNTGIIARVATIGNEDVVIADTIGHGQLIGDTSNYLSSATPSVFPGVGLGIQTDFFGINAGDFINNDELFVGVKFEIGANIHYGWIQVKVDSLAAKGIIYDFAYQSVADSSILGGQLEGEFVSVKEVDLSKVKIYTSNNLLHLNGGTDRGELLIYNLLGKQVMKRSVGRSTLIDLGSLSKGVYLVNYSSGNSTITKKVVIE